MARDHTQALGTLEFALLGLLADAPMNGYDLQKMFDMSLANAWAAGHSQIYPALAKLEKRGLIEVRHTGSRNSKTYGATPDGLTALRSWLDSDPPRTVRNEASLRLFFFSLLGRDDAVARLNKEEAYHRERLERYRELAASFPPKPDHATRWKRVMLERGIGFEAATADWLRWAASEMAKTSTLPRNSERPKPPRSKKPRRRAT